MVALIEQDSDFKVVFQACDGREAVAGWQVHTPDVGLIDLRMPLLDGFEAIEAIRLHARGARLVVMTTLCGDEDIYRALQAGASGYLLKDCGREELSACIRAVAAGQKYLQSTASASLAERVARADLTARESEVLHWLAEGLGNKAIARRLAVAEGTVKTHMKAVLTKLGADSRTQAARIAVQRGLVRPTPGAPSSHQHGPT